MVVYASRGEEVLSLHGHLLFEHSVRAIIYYFRHGKVIKFDVSKLPDLFGVSMATFVTLERGGRLRGCVGSLAAVRNLSDDIVHNTLSAGFADNRFSPLVVGDLEGLQISYSILSDQVECEFSSEFELLSLLRPGIDGLVIEDCGKRAVYLPQVWEQIPDRLEFLSHLRVKAGLDSGHWSDSFRAWVYQADKTTPMLFPKIESK